MSMVSVKQDPGPIVGQEYGEAGTWYWYHDSDGDGKADLKIQYVFYKGKVVPVGKSEVSDFLPIVRR
jgi:hypothetical protein